MKKLLKKIKSIKITKKKVFIFLAILLLFLIGFPKVKAIFQDPRDLYETETATKRDLVQTISASGEVDAKEKAVLKFQTSGKLAWVGVGEGDAVKKWQAIASLDKRQLNLDLQKKLKDFETQFTTFEDTNETYKDDVLDDTIRRVLKRSQNSLDKSVLDVEIANITNQFASIVSPIEGIVTDIENATVGTNIIYTTTSFTVVNPKQMLFKAEVDETDIGQVSLGQKVIITLDAYPDLEIDGEISYISFSSILGEGGGAAFPIEINLSPELNDKLRLGLNGDVEIITAEKENSLSISYQAVEQRGDKEVVKVLGGRKIEEAEVKTGIESDDYIEILSGLSEGDSVIVSEKTK